MLERELAAYQKELGKEQEAAALADLEKRQLLQRAREEYAAWERQQREKYEIRRRLIEADYKPVRELAREVAVAVKKTGKPTVVVPRSPLIPQLKNPRAYVRELREKIKSENQALQAEWDKNTRKAQERAVRAWAISGQVDGYAQEYSHTYEHDIPVYKQWSVPVDEIAETIKQRRGRDCSLYLTVDGRIMRACEDDGPNLHDVLTPPPYEPVAFDQYIMHYKDQPPVAPSPPAPANEPSALQTWKDILVKFAYDSGVRPAG